MSTSHYKPSKTAKSELTKPDPAGTQSYIIKACALDIVWGSDSRYWRIPPQPNSEPIELVQVSWLEVTGSLDLSKLDPNKRHRLFFKLKLKPDAFGWADSPVYFMAKPGKGRYAWKKYDLSQGNPGELLKVPKEPYLEFTIPPNTSPTDELQFGMYEIWRGRWKGGLIIEEVQILQI